MSLSALVSPTVDEVYGVRLSFNSQVEMVL